MFAHILQLMRFTTTGAAAALTHYSVVMLLFQKHVALQYANLLAFLVAYWVSYFGHRIFTFKAQHLDHRQTLPKFTLVAGLGFLFNESFLLLSNLYFNVPVSTLVCIAIVLTSVLTFLLNRFFAFQH
ncbi:GtrA family protein [Acinetobacter sp. XH1741]|uniref:GtrA family protein n=1 Tax=unclassified Acinetobacter TaxID=196816 RepID=UPI0032B3BE04